jgi:hypothetical protein
VDTSKRSMPKSKVDWSNIIATRYQSFIPRVMFRVRSTRLLPNL